MPKIKCTYFLSILTILLLSSCDQNEDDSTQISLTNPENTSLSDKAIAIDLTKLDYEADAEIHPLLTFEGDTIASQLIDSDANGKVDQLFFITDFEPSETKKIQFKKGKIELEGISKSASRLVPIVENSIHFRDTRFMGTIITESIGEKFTIITAVGAKE